MDDQQYLAEGEIDLRNYVNVLVKRKKFILGVLLVAVSSSAIISLSMPKVYEIISTVQIGSINGIVMGKNEAKGIILNQSSLLSAIKELNLKADVESLKKSIKIDDVKDSDLLMVKLTYPDINMILEINKAILNPLITEGQRIYEKRISLVQERLKELDVEIANVEKDIVEAQNLISASPNSGKTSQSDTALQVLVLQNTIPDYEGNLTAIKNQRNRLKFSLAEAKECMIFDAPIKPERPIGPKKRQFVINFGIIGLTLGVFLALFMEFWQERQGR